MGKNKVSGTLGRTVFGWGRQYVLVGNSWKVNTGRQVLIATCMQNKYSIQQLPVMPFTRW